jgi:hypothetical protein
MLGVIPVGSIDADFNIGAPKSAVIAGLVSS